MFTDNNTEQKWYVISEQNFYPRVFRDKETAIFILTFLLGLNSDGKKPDLHFSGGGDDKWESLMF